MSTPLLVTPEQGRRFVVAAKKLLEEGKLMSPLSWENCKTKDRSEWGKYGLSPLGEAILRFLCSQGVLVNIQGYDDRSDPQDPTKYKDIVASLDLAEQFFGLF